jgi:hypothetical protein
MSSLTRHINAVLTTSNKSACLSNLYDQSTTTNSDLNRKQTTPKKCPVPSKNKHKIIILGDSHVKGLSEKISNCIDSVYSVMGVSKPNADLNAITSPFHFKTNQFLKNYVIIVCGRTRNISRNETNKVPRCFKEFVMQASNTNIIILEAPHKHDLEEN